MALISIDPKNTAEALDEEGWLHSGDVAEIDANGRFKIIDRIKVIIPSRYYFLLYSPSKQNIMKLSQGEYVALEKIENTYSTSPLIQQLYVHGDSMQNYLIGVLVPDYAVLAELIHKITHKRVKPEDMAQLESACKDPKVQRAVQHQLDSQAKKAKLRGFEFVKRVHISFEPFTPDNNMLTPTFKIRRRDVYKRYQSTLDKMYKEGEVAKI